MSTQFLSELKSLISEQIVLIEMRQHKLHIPKACDLYTKKGKWHFHSTAEIFIQVSGKSCMQTINGQTICSKKEMMIIPKGISHYEEICHGSVDFRNIVIAFGRKTISIHSAIKREGNLPQINELQQFVSENVPDIVRYLESVILWNNSSSALYNTAARNLLLTVFSLILNNIEDPVRYQRQESRKVNQCRRLVSEHLANQQLSVIWLANIIKCTPDYLSHIFHMETNSKLSVYINDKRVEFAKELLLESILNIAEISYTCGYRDPGYMTRQFRKRCGESPRSYRNGMS